MNHISFDHIGNIATRTAAALALHQLEAAAAILLHNKNSLGEAYTATNVIALAQLIATNAAGAKPAVFGVPK